MNIFFRADASNLIGSGHIARCIQLGKGFKDRGHNVEFICRQSEGDLIETIKKNFKVHALNNSRTIPFKQDDYKSFLGVSQAADQYETLSVLKKERVDLLIIDHYGINEGWEKKLSAISKKLVVIDDLWNKKHYCDLLINQNYTKTGSYSTSLLSHTRTLFGPRFAMLNNDYSELQSDRKLKETHPLRVFIYFGKSDNFSLTKLVTGVFLKKEFDRIILEIVISRSNQSFDELLQISKKIQNINIHYDLPSLSKIMSSCDIGIGAGGVNNLERLCIGLPSIVISIADNQQDSCDALSEDGYIHYFGKADQITEDILYTKLKEILHNREDLVKKSNMGIKLVDGLGVSRVIEEIESILI